MHDTPYDHLAKTAWEHLLGPFRPCEVQREIQLSDLFADFWALPGPPLPEWMGLFAEMASTGLVVGESETGQLTWEKLRHALLKLTMGEELALKLLKAQGRKPGRQEKLEVRGLVIAERVAEKMLRRHLDVRNLTVLEPGLWVYEGRLPMYIVSVRDLAYRDETAVLHVLCRGPNMAEAMGYLMAREEEEAQHLATVLYKEVESMLRESTGHRSNRLSREEAAVLLGQIREKFVESGLRKGRREGRQEGRREGRQEGRQEGRIQSLQQSVSRVWRRKFGVLPDWVHDRVSAASDPDRLTLVLEEIAMASSPDSVEELVRETLPEPSSPS